MRYLHLQLLEQLAGTKNLSPLAERIYLAYAKNQQADFKDIKPFIEFYGKIDQSEKDYHNVEEVIQNKEEILKGYSEWKEKKRLENRDSKKNWFIHNLQIKNFRKYGDLDENENFSLNMEGKNTDTPQSLILIGANGIGKSSLYGAIEDITTDSVSEAVLRNVNKETYTKRETDKYIKLHTNIKDFESYSDFISHFEYREMNVLLCSENDILELGRISQNDDILCWALVTGYKEVYQLIRNMEQVLTDMRSATVPDDQNEYNSDVSVEDRQKLQDGFKELFFSKVGDSTLSQLILKIKEMAGRLETLDYSSEKKVSGLKKSVTLISKQGKQIFSINEKWFLDAGVIAEFDQRCNALKDVMDAFHRTQPGMPHYKRNPLREMVDKTNDLVAFIDRIEDYIYQYYSQTYYPAINRLTEFEKSDSNRKNKDFNDHIELIDRYIQALKELVKSKLVKFFERSRPAIEEVMGAFERTSPNYHLEGDHDKQKMAFSIYNDEFPDKLWIPKIFYNNFRFKLFYMTLKVAAGIAYMEEYGAFPIVMDDIFYASDFYSRKRITNFFISLIKFIREKMKNQVQIICFTHDEVVFSAIRKAVIKVREADHFIFGRLVSPEVVMKKKIAEDGYKDMNLYIRLYGERC